MLPFQEYKLHIFLRLKAKIQLMKNLFFSIVSAVLLVSCNQSEIKQTTDTIKQADSLLKSAKDGFKTLDSISKKLNDSAKFRKIIVPEIEKTKETVQNEIKKNAKNLDSLNREIGKIKDNINKGSDILKTVDSANKKMKESDNVFDKLSTITETISKVSKQTKPKTSAKTEVKSPQMPSPENKNNNISEPEISQNYPQQQTLPQPTVTEKIPLVKTAQLNISVDDLYSAKADLQNEIRSYGGEIVTENFGEQEGVRSQRITAKVPYRFFNEITDNISKNIGSLESKSIESEGKDYDPNQMCDIEITFKEKAAYADGMGDNGNPKKDTFGEKSSSAFMKGFKGLSEVLVAILPFWPLFLIGGLVWYFVRKNKKKKEEEEMRKQEFLHEQQMPQTEKSATENLNAVENKEKDNPQEPDYSKYLPKQ